MYRITLSTSRLTAYNSESGSFSETRQTPSRLSQNADQQGCSARKAVTWEAAYGVGRASPRRTTPASWTPPASS